MARKKKIKDMELSTMGYYFLCFLLFDFYIGALTLTDQLLAMTGILLMMYFNHKNKQNAKK